MHRSEEHEWACCVDCGAEIRPGPDPTFALGAGVLCLDCALRRGGRYDAEQDRWVTEPDFGDLAPAFD
jgi:hypothetical protein